MSTVTHTKEDGTIPLVDSTAKRSVRSASQNAPTTSPHENNRNNNQERNKITIRLSQKLRKCELACTNWLIQHRYIDGGSLEGQSWCILGDKFTKSGQRRSRLVCAIDPQRIKSFVIIFTRLQTNRLLAPPQTTHTHTMSPTSTQEQFNGSLFDLEETQSTASMTSDFSFADMCEASMESLVQQWDIKEKIKQAKAQVASRTPSTTTCRVIKQSKVDDLSYSTHSYEGYHKKFRAPH